MALNLLPFRILGTDKLRTGFRAKYNLLLNKIVKDWRIESDVNHPEYGFLYLITHDDTEIPLDMTGVFYTKEVIDSLFAIGPATEEEAGIIRIATIEEALDGGSGNTAITPYSLYMVLLYLNGRMAIAGEDIVIGDYLYLYLPDDLEEPEEEPPFPILHVKKAIATSEFTLAAGFAESEGLEGEEVFIKLSGNVNTYGEDLTPNVRYYLSAHIPGKLTIHPPIGPGEWQQMIGYAISPLELMFVPDKGWLNWAPIFEDIPTLYFTVGIESSASVELPLLLYPYNVIEGVDDGGFPTIETDYAYRFLLLPEWVTEHTVVFGTMKITGSPTSLGQSKFFLEVTDKNKRTWFQEIVIKVVRAPKITTVLLEEGLDVPKILGPIPGSYKEPVLSEIKITVDGLHDSVRMKVSKGASESGEVLVDDLQDLGSQISLASYKAFSVEGGRALTVGLYRVQFSSFLNETETQVVRFFTLYDDETLNQIIFELWNTVKIGVISIQDDSIFKPLIWFNPRTIVSDIEHDKAILTLYYEEEQVSQEVITHVTPVLVGTYDVYDTPQTGQDAGKYRINAILLLSSDVVMERQSDFTILAKDPVSEGGIVLGTMTPNTANFNELQDLPVTAVEADLPENGYNFLCKGVGGEVDYIKVEFFRKVSGQMAIFDLTKYTKKPDFATFPEPVSEFAILAFRELSSKELGDLHAAPSTVRVRFTGKIGGETGEIVGIRQADVNFRDPIDPAELAGLMFLNINNDTAEVRVIDPNMKLTGGVYALPKMPWYWTVAFTKFADNSEFDRVVNTLKLGGVVLHTPGITQVVDYRVTEINGYPGNVTTQLKTVFEAWIPGTWAGTHRTLLNPSDVPVNIDGPGVFKYESVVSRIGWPLAFPSAEFELKNEEDIEETPEEDGSCCKPKRWDFVNLAIWDIPHNMDSYPEFNLIIGEDEWDNGVKYPDRNNAQVVWNRPRTGFAETK